MKKEEKEKILFNEQDNFNHFMGNMEQYLKLRDGYEREKKQKNVIKTIVKPAIVKPASQPTILLPEKVDNIYSSFFG